MSAPTEMSPDDQVRTEQLLNSAVLWLSGDLRTARHGSERTVIKHQPSGRQLVVTPRQWAQLQQFGPAGRSVPDVLTESIGSQRCPSLSEFYALVLEAVQAGVLQTSEWAAPPDVAPARWPLKVPGAVVRWSVLGLTLAAVAGCWVHSLTLPRNPLWFLAGWALVLGCVSAGWMLAAAVVRAAGGDVYYPRFTLRSVLPGFRVQLDDALLGGRALRLDVALARLLPLVAAVTVAAWRVPELLVPLVLGWLLELSPLWPSPAHAAIAARWRDPRLAAAYGIATARNRLLSLLRHARAQWEERAYLLASAVATVLWLVVAGVVAVVLLNANARQLWDEFNAGGGWRHAAIALLGLLVAFGLVVAGIVVAVAVGHVRAWAAERAERRLRPQAVLVSAQTIADWLSRTVLFRGLPADDLAAIGAVVKVEELGRGTYVVKEGEAGDRLYVVVSGRLEVRRDYAPGRSEPVALIGEGEVFGEIALLHGGVRTRSVRALERSQLLSLGREDFERLVLTRMSREAVFDEVQKVGFLKQVELTRGWRFSALAAFARQAKFRELPEGGVFLRAGDTNHWFYLVHRGELAVELNGRELRRLQIGDSFGELSLLGDGTATSTVVVRSKQASCLVIAGREFLEFVTHDFAAGLQWEKLRPRRREGERTRR